LEPTSNCERFVHVQLVAAQLRLAEAEVQQLLVAAADGAHAGLQAAGREAADEGRRSLLEWLASRVDFIIKKPRLAFASAGSVVVIRAIPHALTGV
jgi:hypothetical protein